MEITLLYTSLIAVLAVFLSFKTGLVRGKTNTMLGEGDSSELLQSMRAFGNLVEYAPLALILLALLEMQNLDAWKLHMLGSLYFLLVLYISIRKILYYLFQQFQQVLNKATSHREIDKRSPIF